MSDASRIAAEFTHVVFEQIHPRAKIAVALEDANDFVINCQALHISISVHSAYRHANPAQWSWAKEWSSWNGDAGYWELNRIGVGAYGDLTIWTHPNRTELEAIHRRTATYN